MASEKLDFAKEKLADAGKLTEKLSKDIAKKTVEVAGAVADKIGDAYEYSVISGILAEPVKALTAEQTKLLKGFRRELEFKGVISEDYFEQVKTDFTAKLVEVANNTLGEIPDHIHEKKVLGGYTFDENLLVEVAGIDDTKIQYTQDIIVDAKDTKQLKSAISKTAFNMADKFGTKAIGAISKKLGKKGVSKAVGNIPVVGIALSFAVDEAVERGDKFVKLRNESLAFYAASGLQEYFTDLLTETTIIIADFKNSLEESGEAVDQKALDSRFEDALED
jgi:hypothetical protein